jgi:pyruvate,water dikinase
MRSQYVFDLNNPRLPKTVGNKARNLRFLTRKGFRVPATLVVTWDAYRRHLDEDPELREVLEAELLDVLDLDCPYAVRSSANIEDQVHHSFAGQFKSVLNARGTSDILRAIESIWATSRAPGAIAYMARHDIDPDQLNMAIIVQAMVHSVVSGVAFSKNPMTGMDEVIVEAVEGSGEALVQQGVTPERWVNKWGAWVETPHADQSRRDLIQEVVDQTKAIAKIYGQPVDLEWVYDGHAVYWVQLREITSLDIDLYSNRISREVFPGIIKPLIWSINVPLVNSAWVKLFTELIGPNDIDPDSLAETFYYRAYFNMGIIGRIFELLGFPRESLELLIGIELGGPDKPRFRPTGRTYILLPRMLLFLIDKLLFGRRIGAFLPAMERRYRATALDDVAQLSEDELIAGIQRLYCLNQETAYYNIVAPLLMQAYNHALKGLLSRLDIDFERLDLTSDMQELERFDPNVHLVELHRDYLALDEGTRARLKDLSYDELLETPGVDRLRDGLQRFIEEFGHLSDSGNDFSSIPWREDPDLILRMVVDYAPPEGPSGTGVRLEDLKITAMWQPLIRWVYRRARRFRLHREAISSLYTFGYGLFRVYFLALGDHLVRRGTVSAREDVFYLDIGEVKAILVDERDLDWKERVAQTKREIAAYADVVPPNTIYGDEVLHTEIRTSDRLKGTPTSRGQYTGPVRVMQGLRDFGSLREGDVLAVPYSDVGWTPLFTKAGAVIAESGGLLSHSSIVAREYNIPAVVSVPGACRIPNGTLLTVDGYRGEVIIHERQSGDSRMNASVQSE